jgi:acetyl esterase/lipase
LSLGFIVAGASAGAQMSAVVTHLAKKDRLSPPITGQLLSVGWYLDQAHKNILDVPQEWKDEITSEVDNAEAAIVSKRTIDAIIGMSCRHKSRAFRTNTV